MQPRKEQADKQAEKWRDLARQSKELGLAPWSFSKLSLLDACPLSFYHSYLVPREERTGKHKYQAESALAGQFNHNVLEHCVKLTTEDSVENIKSRYPSIWAELFDQHSLTTAEEDLVYTQRSTTRRILDRVLGVIEKYELTPYPEALLCMDTDTGRFVWEDLPYNRRMFTLYIDFLGLTKDNRKALILDYKSYQKDKEKAKRDKIQTDFYTLAVLGCIETVENAQPGCVYIPDEKIDTRKVKNRDQHLHILHRDYRRWIKDALALVQHCLDRGKFPRKRSRQCKWCPATKEDCGWAKAR